MLEAAIASARASISGDPRSRKDHDTRTESQLWTRQNESPVHARPHFVCTRDGVRPVT